MKTIMTGRRISEIAAAAIDSALADLQVDPQLLMFVFDDELTEDEATIRPDHLAALRTRYVEEIARLRPLLNRTLSLLSTQDRCTRWDSTGVRRCVLVEADEHICAFADGAGVKTLPVAGRAAAAAATLAVLALAGIGLTAPHRVDPAQAYRNTYPICVQAPCPGWDTPPRPPAPRRPR